MSGDGDFDRPRDYYVTPRNPGDDGGDDLRVRERRDP